MATRDHSFAEAQRRILIVRIGAMGDILHAMPAVAALRQAHPDWFLGWVVEPRWMPLLQAPGEPPSQRGPAMPLVDRVYPASTREWKKQPFSSATVRDIASLRRQLRSEHFDLCVDMQGSIRSAVIGRMASAKSFAGPEDPREAPARWLYGKKVSTHAAHVIEQGCELLGEAIGQNMHFKHIQLPEYASSAYSTEALLKNLLPDGEPFVLLAPTAGWGAKQWPAERFGAVAAELGRKGYRSLVNAAGPDDPVAQKVVALSHGYAVAAAGDISQLIELTRRTSLVIAGDTGPLHLAAALQKPVVALFGPTDPARNGPYGTASRVLRHGGERRDHRRLAEPEAGLLAITVEEVVEAAAELLQDPRANKVR